MKLPIDVRMWLWFGGTWVFTKAVDMLIPPEQPLFNIGLSLAALIVCWARHIEKARNQ